jgi:hypothetical protein
MAGSYFLETALQFTGRTQSIQEISAKSLYAPIAYPGGGTEPDDLETQISARGANLEASVPDLDPNGNCTEAFMEDKSWMTPALSQGATTRAGWTPMTVNIDIDSMAEAIQNEGGIIIVIQGQNNGTWLSPYPQPPVNDQDIWEHFMCGFGNQTANKGQQLDFLQSWGIEVGDQGIQNFTEAYINSGYIVDCFTFMSDNALQPIVEPNEPAQVSIWQSLVLFFKSIPNFFNQPSSVSP